MRPSLPAADHAPGDRVGLAEQARGLGEIAGLQRGADAGAGHRLAVERHRRDGAGGEAAGGPERRQQLEVARAGAAEAEIRAHPDFARMQAIDQQPLHEVLRRKRRDRRVEPQQADRVHTQLAEAVQLAARQLQPRGRRGGREELARQRLEAQRHRRQGQRAGTLDRAGHQRTMAQVQAVEGADAHHAAVGAQRPAVEIAEQIGHRDIGSGRAGGPERPQGNREAPSIAGRTRTRVWLNARAAPAGGSPSPPWPRHRPARRRRPAPAASRSAATGRPR